MAMTTSSRAHTVMHVPFNPPRRAQGDEKRKRVYRRKIWSTQARDVKERQVRVLRLMCGRQGARYDGTRHPRSWVMQVWSSSAVHRLDGQTLKVCMKSFRKTVGIRVHGLIAGNPSTILYMRNS